MRSLIRLGSTAVLSSLVTAAILLSCTAAQPGPAGTPSTPPEAGASPGQPAQVTPAPPATVAPPAGAQEEAVSPATRVYRDVGPSVVNITSIVVVRDIFTLQTMEQPRGTGSGWIYDNQGHIVTNSHVVENADQLQVTFANRTTVPARLVGRDAPNDLAVIKVDGPSELIRPARLGDSDRVLVGEPAITIGSPFGLQQTVTAGIVSALRQPLESEPGTPGAGIDLLGGAIQTDAAINPGNSGGPLLNARGEVIGVNTAIVSGTGGNVGIGFAIPVNVVKRVVPELIQRGYYPHPLIGVTTIPLTPRLAQQLGVGIDHGLLVQAVEAGAADAGVRAGTRPVSVGGERVLVGGDVITAIDGQEIKTGGDLRAYVENNKRPGDRVTLTLWRNGQTLEVQVTLTERPRESR